MSSPDSGPWPRCPEAAAFFRTLLDRFADANPPVATLRGRLAAVGVDIAALTDHWIVPEGSVAPDVLSELGLVETVRPEGDRVWEHPAARLPALRFKKRPAPVLALLVDAIDAFAAANGLEIDACHGDPDAAYRCGHVALPVGELMPIERRGTRAFAPGDVDPDTRAALEATRARLRNRPRDGAEAQVVAAARACVDDAAAALGMGRAVDEFFAAEREFYQGRNAAARWQKARQDAVGIGWANHDHHTYRSSRDGFQDLTRLFEGMGFVARERFYAGDEAGWGAQIFEHPDSRVVIFADVDLAPEERDVDFAAQPLAPRADLGTIGLWCALHGSSIAAAGMHHLECEFLHDIVRDQYVATGGDVMAPFTDLPMLWQAFTRGEMWPVAPERLAALAAAGQITAEQARRFADEGALGSHLEILQRWDGYKGFNKTAVSGIIRATDARR